MYYHYTKPERDREGSQTNFMMDCIISLSCFRTWDATGAAVVVGAADDCDTGSGVGATIVFNTSDERYR